MGKNKRPRSYYIQSAKRQKRRDSFLGPDMMGFLCMCNGHERECVQESYNILNEFANELYGKEEWQCKDSFIDMFHAFYIFFIISYIDV